MPETLDYTAREGIFSFIADAILEEMQLREPGAGISHLVAPFVFVFVAASAAPPFPLLAFPTVTQSAHSPFPSCSMSQMATAAGANLKIHLGRLAQLVSICNRVKIPEHKPVFNPDMAFVGCRERKSITFP
jgi:hypothetical protein